MSGASHDPPTPTGEKAAPRLHRGLGWWAVLVAAVLWMLDTNSNLGVPRKYAPTVRLISCAGYAMIAARAAFALLFRNRSWWWLAYASLLAFVPLLVSEWVRTASDNWQ